MGKNQLQASKANRSWRRKPGDGSPVAEDSLLQVGEWWKGSTFRLRSEEGSRSRNAISSCTPSPTRAPSEAAATPARQPPRGDPAAAGPQEMESSAAAAPKRWLCAGREPPPRPDPPHSPRPPGSRCAHRLHGGGHVVVALRLLRQSRPLQQLLSVPHVSRDSASPRAPAPPACSLARPPARPLPGLRRGRRRARALARRLAGGCRLRRGSRPLAGWLHAQWRGPRSRGERTGGRRGRAGGRTRPRLRTRSGEPREGERGGPALTVFFKVTSSTINSCG